MDPSWACRLPLASPRGAQEGRGTGLHSSRTRVPQGLPIERSRSILLPSFRQVATLQDEEQQQVGCRTSQWLYFITSGNLYPSLAEATGGPEMLSVSWSLGEPASTAPLLAPSDQERGFDGYGSTASRPVLSPSH